MYTIKHLTGIGTAHTLIEAKMTALIMSETLPGHFHVLRDGCEIATYFKGKSTHSGRYAQQRIYQANKRYTEKQKAKALAAGA
jgi:hypothetical protein